MDIFKSVLACSEVILASELCISIRASEPKQRKDWSAQKNGFPPMSERAPKSAPHFLRTSMFSLFGLWGSNQSTQPQKENAKANLKKTSFGSGTFFGLIFIRLIFSCDLCRGSRNGLCRCAFWTERATQVRAKLLCYKWSGRNCVGMCRRST